MKTHECEWKPGDVQETARGFGYINFTDHNNNQCSIQQSSICDFSRNPGASAVWLGIRSGRMHLTREMVIWLAGQLTHWAETGMFDEALKSEESDDHNRGD